MTKRDLKYLSVILTILISGAGASCVPKIVTPDINRASYVELKDTEPDCSQEIQALEGSSEKTDGLILDALYCYRKLWKHWENSYRVLDAQVGAINESE